MMIAKQLTTSLQDQQMSQLFPNTNTLYALAKLAKLFSQMPQKVKTRSKTTVW